MNTEDGYTQTEAHSIRAHRNPEDRNHLGKAVMYMPGQSL